MSDYGVEATPEKIGVDTDAFSAAGSKNRLLSTQFSDALQETIRC
jgi:hypothetical protein